MKKKKKPASKSTPAKELTQKIHEALLAFHLPVMAENWIKMATNDFAEHGRLIPEALWQLIEPQLLRRQENAIKRRMDRAKFPALKSLDNFDFLFQPKLDRKRVMELATMDFIHRGENVLIGGMSGTGKSHIAISLGYLACAAGYSTRYTTSAAMLTELHAAMMTSMLSETLRDYVNCECLIIDEVGLDRPEQEATRDAQLLYKVISPRYQNPKSTIITSNIDWTEWGKALGDDIATVAILDRLLHHGHLINIDGPSYRAKEHERLNAQREMPKPSSK
jgi:DNA replication protein DnaC